MHAARVRSVHSSLRQHGCQPCFVRMDMWMRITCERLLPTGTITITGAGGKALEPYRTASWASGVSVTHDGPTCLHCLWRWGVKWERVRHEAMLDLPRRHLNP